MTLSVASGPGIQIDMVDLVIDLVYEATQYLGQNSQFEANVAD
jgi:hypothetical protein